MPELAREAISANQWILDEAQDDSLLLNLIAQRESLFVEADIDAGISIHDETADLKMRSITAQIRERKYQLGIDSTKEP